MFPFDRLIRLMDEWAAASGRDDVFAQIGDGRYLPRHMDYVRSLTQADFAATVRRAGLVVAHAGMGTVITAGRFGRPLVLLPRRQEWGEHTTDHQIATAGWLRNKPGIHVADTDADLPGAIAAGLSAPAAVGEVLPAVADPAFTDRLRGAIGQFLKQASE